MRWILIFLAISTLSFAQAKEVKLFGNATEYAGINLTVEYQNNYITRSFRDLKSFLVDKKGNFSASFKLEEITRIYINLGEIRGHLLVEPGKTYELVLPPYTPLKQADRLNPFFRPEPVVIGIKNDTGSNLNRVTSDFEEKYNYLFSKNIRRIVLTGNKKQCFKIIEDVDMAFPADSGTWFYYYKFFKYQNLYDYIYSNKPRVAIANSFAKIPVQYHLDTYWTSFNRQFSNFFHYYFSSKQGESFKKIWNTSHSFNAICAELSKDTLFKNRELSELIVLRGLYSGYFSDLYPKARIISIVESSQDSCVNTENNQIASAILTRITKLNVGSQAPDFNVNALFNGKPRELKDYKGKFVYLNFANTKNYACKKDFQVLEQMHEKYKKDMYIITILTDEDPDEAAEYIKSNKFSWRFLHFGQNAKVLFDYNIQAFPTYYLIDPEGNLVLSPAPAPEENFAPAFSEIYKNHRNKKLRKDKPKSRSIYDI
ncbi:TlpA family protein disulfide reductase [Labilibacter marinus]|uniref:TlpA family protein disulfide reductase n=1 Tax=Labilibacter marinus TaxID=1477105 RepID=UPI00130184EB|nr:TlpA disulfide reductase family protein [Labilibacter marinus]